MKYNTDIRVYMVLHIDNNPIVVYINKIVAIKAYDDYTEIDCINGISYCVDEYYSEVMEMINK